MVTESSARILVEFIHDGDICMRLTPSNKLESPEFTDSKFVEGKKPAVFVFNNLVPNI